MNKTKPEALFITAFEAVFLFAQKSAKLTEYLHKKVQQKMRDQH